MTPLFIYDLIILVRGISIIFFMVQKAIYSYYDLLDQRIKEGTVIILIISFLIFSVGILSWDTYRYKSSLHEYDTISPDNIVTIDWIRYKLVLQEVK